MLLPLQTPSILYHKINNASIDDALVQCAIDMLEAGFDTEHLRIIAGAIPPYNNWYTGPLTDKVFNEPGISLADKQVITHNYICYVVLQAIEGNNSLIKALIILRGLYLGEATADGLRDGPSLVAVGLMGLAYF